MLNEAESILDQEREKELEQNKAFEFITKFTKKKKNRSIRI